MRLLNSLTLEFVEFDDGVIPPYAVLSHTWGEGEILYRDMVFLQEYKLVYETYGPPEEGIDNLKLGVDDDSKASPPYTPSPMPSTSTSTLEPPTSSENASASSISGPTPSPREEFRALNLRSKAGYQKILSAARMAHNSQIKHIWIDTCCIDRSSSAEISEAINSAYKYYKDAVICFIYLADVPPTDVISEPDSVFRRSWWFTRGWTAVELLAPTATLWFDQDWNFIFPNVRLIQEITGIEAAYISGRDPSKASVAQRMSWAAFRSTSKKEDRAYCLLGLFDVNMSILYGEGAEKAFARLQRKILKTTNDPSIFMWGYDTSLPEDGSRLLAKSPDEFAGCKNLILNKKAGALNRLFSLGPLGLEIDSGVSFLRNRNKKVWETEHFLAMSEVVDSTSPNDGFILPLGNHGASTSGNEKRHYSRLPGSGPVRISRQSFLWFGMGAPKPIFLRSDIPPSKPIVDIHFTPQETATLPLKLVEVFPPHRFMPSQGFVSLVSNPVDHTTMFLLRYEETAAGLTQRQKRRVIVILEYKGYSLGKEGPFVVTKSSVRVADRTSEPTPSLCDWLSSRSDMYDGRFWAKSGSCLTVGDLVVEAGLVEDGGSLRLWVRASADHGV